MTNSYEKYKIRTRAMGLNDNALIVAIWAVMLGVGIGVGYCVGYERGHYVGTNEGLDKCRELVDMTNELNDLRQTRIAGEALLKRAQSQIKKKGDDQ